MWIVVSLMTVKDGTFWEINLDGCRMFEYHGRIKKI